jgi:hypothetical protein
MRTTLRSLCEARDRIRRAGALIAAHAPGHGTLFLTSRFTSLTEISVSTSGAKSHTPRYVRTVKPSATAAAITAPRELPII